MGRTGKKNLRGPKNVDLNPNPGASEENGVSNSNDRRQTSNQSGGSNRQSTKFEPWRDRDPVLGKLMSLPFDAQVLITMRGLDPDGFTPEAAAQKHADLLLRRIDRKRQANEHIGKGFLRAQVLDEFAGELSACKRKVESLDGKTGQIVLEDEERYALRLIEVAKSIPNGPGMKYVRDRLNEMLGEIRSYKQEFERRRREDQRRAQQVPATGESSERSYSDPGQSTTIGDIAGEELQKTGTEG